MDKNTSRRIRMILSVLFVLAVGFFVAKSCVHKKHVAERRVSVVTRSSKIQKAKSIKKGTPPAGAAMAIILDDWGNNYSLLQGLIAIDRPVTVAVIPNLKQSRRIADEAYANGLGVMIHMPMQPKNTHEPLEPHTILTTSPPVEIRSYLREAVASVPHAEGMNNHMGSAVTADARVMREVLEFLKARGLFFVDSQVVPNTVSGPIAKEIGLPFTKRDVFIDNEPDKASIKKQILRAKKIALTQGRVVVIGHDKRFTIQAIQEMVPELEKDGVKLVLVRDILE